MSELTNEKLYQILNGTKVKLFKKKPIIIEAFQYQGHVNDIPWLDIEIPRKEYDCCYINSLEGIIRCEINDYIIKGIKGEFYACKPDIFAASYDLVEE